MVILSLTRLEMTDAQDYDAQINALMDGGSATLVRCTTPVFRYFFNRSEWWFRILKQCSATNRKSNAKDLLLLRPVLARLHSKGDRPTRFRKIQDVMKNVVPMTPTPSDSKYRRIAPDCTASMQESL